MSPPLGETPATPVTTSRVIVPDWVRGRRRGASTFHRHVALVAMVALVSVAGLGLTNDDGADGLAQRALRAVIPLPAPLPPTEPAVPAVPPDWDGGPSPALLLSYAGINYMNGGPADPVIELKLIMVNSGERHTDSTSIRWEPSFARDYTFLKSDPPAWRVRVDEWGWGVYDGPGVLPQRDGTYVLWFTRTGFRVDEPRVQAIGNGNIFVDDTYAIAMNRILNREPPAQGIFERKPLLSIIDWVGGAVPDAIETAPFGFALGLAWTLTALVTGGMVAALRRSSATPSGPRNTNG